MMAYINKCNMATVLSCIIMSYVNYAMEKQPKSYAKNMTAPGYKKSGTSFWKAIHDEDCAVIQTYLDKGMDVNKKNTLIIATLHQKHISMACLLKDPNVNVNKLNCFLQTALFFAKDPLSVHILVKHGIDTNISDCNDDTALIGAVLDGRADCVQGLLQYPHIEKDCKNSAGETALLVAIKKKNKPIITHLLNAGADPELANEWNLTPYEAATRMGLDEEVLDLIRQAIIKKHGGVNPFIEGHK